MKRFRYFPFALVLVFLWSILRVYNLMDFSGTVASAVLTFLCFAAVILEFFKSGDITLGFFGWDMITSVIETILATATFTVLFSAEQGKFNLTDVFVAGLVICDAWFSPYNSFRIALRNWQASIGSDVGH